jgi:hypothetical protein
MPVVLARTLKLHGSNIAEDAVYICLYVLFHLIAEDRNMTMKVTRVIG